MTILDSVGWKLNGLGMSGEEEKGEDGSEEKCVHWIIIRKSGFVELKMREFQQKNIIIKVVFIVKWK